MSLSRLARATGFLLTVLLSACASSPDNADNSNSTVEFQTELEHALSDFRNIPELDYYFDNAEAIVILPNNFRAGTGFGGAIGKGWLVEDGVVTDIVWHWQFLAGADLGFQVYQQILFLKEASDIALFRSRSFQFAGQANATLIVWGAVYNPSYNEGVALFTLIDGGLLIEASVGLHSYHLFPLNTDLRGAGFCNR
jgi:lipid-binding SYLF domain-containing protein